MTNPDNINALAALIRRVDGNHELGTAQLAERLVEAGVRIAGPEETLVCSQCGQPLSARACGPTHAVLKADPTRHVNYPNLDTR